MSLPTTSECVADLVWQTPRAVGAVAIGRLAASDPAALDAILHRLTARTAPRAGQIAHRNFSAIDDGLIVRIAPTGALIMPHGGPRIVAQLDAWFRAHGVRTRDDSEQCVEDARADALRTYPEARCFREALALAAAARATSARAIPLLLAQPARIEAACSRGWTPTAASTARDARRNRLLHPPRIVAVGAANVGKSSLINAVAGRTVAIAMDFAGTTRDAVAARVELDGLVVDWFDTPGIRATDDEVERAAQSLAETLRAGADLLLEVCAPGIACPQIESDVARVRVCTRIDLDQARVSVEARASEVHVSATEQTGLTDLACAIRRALLRDEDLTSEEPWMFHPAAASESHDRVAAIDIHHLTGDA